MKTYIGNSLISKLTPKERQYDIRDTKLLGFLIRVNPSGKMYYVCQYKRGHRINIGRVGVLTPAQARDRAKVILADIAKGVEPNFNKKNQGITLHEFLENHYSPWVRTHRKVGHKTLAHIRRCFIGTFGDRPLFDLSPAQIDQWRTQRLKKGRTTETVNRDVATFKAALSKAVLWGLIEKHPLEKLKLLRSDKNIKVRFLSLEEEKSLREVSFLREQKIKKEREKANQWRQERGYDVLPNLSEFAYADHMNPMILLSINTGLRRGELFNLKWENIDFQRALCTVEGHNAKSGKTRHIPLNSEAMQVLKAWHRQTDGTDLVFPSKDNRPFNTIKKAWAGILKIAKIKSFRWHDLRHHFASKLVMAGVDLNTVRELLGHSDMTMTLRYAHLAPEHKANAVEKIVPKLFKVESNIA